MSDDGGKIARKNRTAMSCDRCKARKTKCKNPVPGPCDYCRSIDEVCQIDVGKRRKRPYYFVSEEEYRHMQKILRHYLPDTDLTLPALRSIASQCDQNHNQASVQQLPNSITAINPITESQSMDKTYGTQGEEDVALQEIAHLHADLGCMLADGRGEYRYTGADSGISFNAAVRTMKIESPQTVNDKDVIAPLSTVTLPVPVSNTAAGLRLSDDLHLPAKDLCLQWVSRYFEEVHCLHWLYSSEQFHTRLEATYVHQGRAVSDSWLCSLYCIFALGALGTSQFEDSMATSTAGVYLDMAKSLTSKVCDEADLDSVRAMILLALALQSHGFSNSAYLYTGIAVRIAFSLGLHLDKYSASYGPVEKEHARRIWWALYVFDQDIALRVGKPCLTGPPAGLSWQPPMPSEQILNPGPNTPSGYLEVSIGLSQLTKVIRDSLYIGPAIGGSNVSLTKIGEVLSSLRSWLASVPPHLSSTVPTAPLHQRPVAILHVRYWSVVILVSRPFMLYSLLHRNRLDGTSKLRYFEELSNVCVDAAERSLSILQRMVESRRLSSVVVSDFYYILDLVQVFLIALALDRSVKHLDHVKECLKVFQAMERFGFCERMLPEVLNQLKSWGVLHEEFENPASLQEFGTSLMGTESGNDFYEMLFDANNMIENDSADMFLDGLDLTGGVTDEELLQQIMGMSHFAQAPIVN